MSAVCVRYAKLERVVTSQGLREDAEQVRSSGLCTLPTPGFLLTEYTLLFNFKSSLQSLEDALASQPWLEHLVHVASWCSIKTRRDIFQCRTKIVAPGYVNVE